MRVLVSGVVLDQPMGGVRRHNVELLPRLARILAAEGGELAVLEGRGGIGFELSGSIERLPSAVPSRPALVRAGLETRALAEALRGAAREGRRFDVVHTAHLPAPGRLPVPMTITVHDLRSLDLPHTPFSRRLVARSVIGRALGRAAAVFAVSETTAARLREGWPDVAPRVALVPNAADHIDPLPRAPDPGAPILHLGHLEPRKNLELVVRALAADPGLPDLLLAGSAKGDERERLEALARELGVERRVRFHGAYGDDELPRLLATCACVALPSRLEGFGIVALEAQRARAPLAVSTAGALPEVAGPGVPTFDPGDPGACARAVRAAMAQDAVTLEEHARRAGRYRWDDSAEAWARGLADAVRRGGRG